MEGIELAIEIENTAAFIAAKPVTLTLHTIDERVRTDDFGWRDIPGDDRAPQVFRIIEQNSSSVPVLQLQDGTQRDLAFVLLGTPDRLVAVGDTWEEGSRVWYVGDIVRSNQYEIRALVVERGK